jgi:succinoglycan biosynthesis transport protein ExoP
VGEGHDMNLIRGDARLRSVASSGPLLDVPHFVRGYDNFEWDKVVRILMKNRRISLFFAIAVLLSALVITFRMKNVYEPTARLEIDPFGIGILQAHDSETASETGTDYVETQAQILRSEALALSVIRTLRLDQRTEIVGKEALSARQGGSEPTPPPSAPLAQPVLNSSAAKRLEQPTTLASHRRAPALAIDQVHALGLGSSTQLIVVGNGPLVYAVYRATLPSRLIIDFAGAHLNVSSQSLLQEQEKPLPWVRRVRLGQFQPDVARVVIDLDKTPVFEVSSHNNDLTVILSPPNNLHKLSENSDEASVTDGFTAPADPIPAPQAPAGTTVTAQTMLGSPAQPSGLALASSPAPDKLGQSSGQQPSSQDQRTVLESIALRHFRDNLTVNTSRNSRLVEVSFASSDPRLATDVTNTLVKLFIDNDYRTRYESTMRASNWLSGQLEDLRQKVQKSNETLAEYQKENGILDVDEKDNPITQKAIDLNRQFSQAQADRIQMEASARMAETGDADSLPQVHDNFLIQSLTQKLAESRSQLARALSVYGEKNSNVRRLRGESDELAAQLAAEKRDIVSGLRTSYGASLTRERLMAQAVDQLKRMMGDMDVKMVQYRILRNESQASSELYNSLLARLEQAGVYAGLQSGNIRIVDPAAIPDRASSPHRGLIIAVGLVIAVMGSIALAFLKEGLDNTVRTPDEITQWTGLPSLPMIPRIPLGNGHARRFTSTAASPQFSTNGSGSRQTAALPRLMSSDARTPQADAMRNLRTSILFSRHSTAPGVFVVAAPSSGEGSTTIAANLAIVLARHGKTCLVDGDMRRPAVAGAFAIAPNFGLSNILMGSAKLEQAFTAVSRFENLSLLAGGPIPLNPADLLTSLTMRQLVSALREQFQFVVIDSPPVIPFSDARVLSSLADAVILVSRSGVTTRRAMIRCAELLGETHAPVLGVIINDIDLNSADYTYYNGFSGASQKRYIQRYTLNMSSDQNYERKAKSTGH